MPPRTRELRIRIAGDAGDASKALGQIDKGAKGAGDGLDKLGADAAGVKTDLGQAERAAKDAGKGFLDFGDDAMAGAKDVAAGMAMFEGAKEIAGGFSDAFAAGLEFEQAGAKLTAQLGGMSPLSADAGKAAGNLYAGAWGDSMGEVNDAIRGVIQEGLVMEDASVGQLEAMGAKAIDVSKIFDQDLSATMRAAGQMVKTGLADNATEAFDILTRGFQQGGDRADDLLDTFNEYGTQFRSLGLDGQTAMGLITQGLQAGARDADTVADAIKEFAIEATSGGDRVREGFEMVGLDADRMFTLIGEGGDQASGAFMATLDALRGIEDPTRRSEAAVALFGTKAEDMGEAIFALDPGLRAVETSLGNVEGAAQEAGDTFNDTGQVKMTEFQRRTEMAMTGLLDAPGIIGTASAAVGGLGAAVLPVGGDLGGMALAMGSVGKVFGDGKLSGAINTVSGALKTGLGGAFSFIAAHPVMLVLIGLAALFIILWTRSETFRNIVTGVFRTVGQWAQTAFGWIMNAGQNVWNWLQSAWPTVRNILVNPIQAAVGWITGAWNGLRTGFSAVANWIGARVGDVIGFFSQLPGRIANFFNQVRTNIQNAFKGAINTVIGWWNRLSFTLPKITIPAIKIGPLTTPGGTFGGQTFRVPQIPRLAEGTAFVPQNMLAMLHRGEAVLPRPMAEDFRGGGGTVVIDMRGSFVADGVQFQRHVVDALAEAGRKGMRVQIRGRRL